MEIMDYVVATIHMQGFARIFTTANFIPAEAYHEAVKARGEEIVTKGFTILNNILPDVGYAVGEFSIADAALFYVEFWADKLHMELPLNCRAHYQQMLTRPVVKRVLMEEGYYQ